MYYNMKQTKMRGSALLIIAFIIVISAEVTYGHPLHIHSRSLQKPLFRDSCSYTCDNLASLLALSRNQNEKEEPVKEVVTSSAMFNADELIMKLVNALVYATTQRVQNHCHCHCPHSTKSFVPDDTHYNGGGSHSVNSDNGHSNGGLLNLDLLNSNKRDNLVDIDLSNQHLIGVGLGGRNQGGSSSYGSSGARSNNPIISTSRTSSATSSDDLVNVALLDSKNPNNIAAVNLGSKTVVGVGLSGDVKDNRRQGNDIDDDLVNLHVLNANNDNNVAELAVAGQNVLGIGVGGSNNG